MEIIKEINEGNLLIKLNGWLDHASSPELGEVIDAIDSAKSITIDMANVEYVSSAGIRQIVAAHRKSKELNADYSVINVSKDVMSVLAITGLDKKLNIVAKQ